MNINDNSFHMGSKNRTKKIWSWNGFWTKNFLDPSTDSQKSGKTGFTVVFTKATRMYLSKSAKNILDSFTGSQEIRRNRFL